MATAVAPAPMDGDAPVHLRLATKEDLPAIAAIVGLQLPLMAEAGNPQWDETYPLPCHFQADIVQGQLWVAVAPAPEPDGEGAVVGVGALTESPEPDYAQAGCDLAYAAIVPHRIAVDPRQQRRGIASLFLAQAERLAVERGHAYVRIDTNKRNPAMPTLITKCGYTFMGEVSLTGKPASYRYLVYEKKVA
jgi:GNAT superfamily N-acetyltransferase